MYILYSCRAAVPPLRWDRGREYGGEKRVKKSERLHGRERDAIIMSERPGGRIYSYCR